MVIKEALPSGGCQPDGEKFSNGRISSPNTNLEGHLNGICPNLSPQSSPPQRPENQKSKRTKWNREEYKEVIYAYYFALSRPNQEKHTANSYRIWRSQNPASRPNLDENRLANVRRDIFRNTRLTDAELTSIKKVVENDLNASQERNNEAEERNVGPQALTERRPSAESTQDPEEEGKYDPRKNSPENDVETDFENHMFVNNTENLSMK
ncbi:Hypothetical predicted protein [Octopus vulgaris]|uniref:Uncharacterized protein n=1 Tax=Octopus vulgaris TaxID=6645 RepID=A0AA36AF56_OCTVU|nr:Hypothetical predicted protein [Octopus vulgaris]